MIRPVLLAALVVCSLGTSLVAVQPTAGDVISETTTDDSDGESSEDYGGDGDDDNWYDRWRSDGENRPDDRDDGQDRDSHGTDGDPAEQDTNVTADGESPETDGDGENETRGDDGDEPARENGTDERAWRNRSVNATGYVLDATVETTLGVTDGTTRAVDRAGVPGGGPFPGESSATRAPEDVSVVATDGTVETHTATPAVGRLLEGDYRELGVDYGEADDLLGLSVPSWFYERGDGANTDRPTTDADHGPNSDGDAAWAGTRGDGGAAAIQRAGDGAAEPADGDEASDRGDGDDEDPSGSPAGAAAALFVTVGCLGGSRVAVTQANLLASSGYEGTVTSLRRFARDHLAGLPDRLVPPVVGYSRHDGSDPLENETRAAIYDLVRESPGIYHARLAEETGVAVETVRYHCRVLADEGLVEPRKHRGKRRLFPVSMDDDDPELAAAIADSAAAGVLSAIRQLEPATLSAVAEHVDCAPSTVAYHLDRLEEDGLVSRERDGGAVQVRLRRSTRSALERSVADD